MSTSLALPTYACSCLNVKIFPKKVEEIDVIEKKQSQTPNNTPPKAPPGWETICIDKGSVVIVQDQLMSKIRSEGGLQFVCRLCDTLVYRQVGGSDSISSMHSTTTPDSATTALATPAKGGPVSTARDRPDFENLFRQDKNVWIQVWTGQRGCISGRQLESTLQAVSPVFGLVIPANSDALTPSPTPPTHTLPLPSASSSTGPPPISALSTSLLTTNASSHQQSQVPRQPLLTLPQLFPPPPITPSHALFTNLARDAKKVSDAAREAAEAEIAKFIEAKRREVMEQEARLKKQVYAIWKTWKEFGQSDQLPSPSATSAVDSISGITDPRPAIKKHTSSSSTSSDASSRTRAIIRTFEEEPASPRPVQRPTNIRPNASSPNTVPYSSSMSPSNATPRVRPTMSALGTSLRQSTMHYPQKPPSPPLAGADEENFDMEFDDVVSGRERPQTRKAAASPPTHTSDNAPNRHQKPKASAMKRVSMDATKSKPVTIDSSSDLSTEGSVSTEGQTGRRKAVKFSNDQPDVVTVTREIESEKLQKLQEEQARGEEAIFDLDDGDEEGDSTRTGDKRVKSSPPAVALKEESIDPLQPITSPVQEPESPRAKFSFPRLSQVGNEKTRNIEYTLAKSLPTTSTLANLANRSAGGVGSLGLDVESRMDQVASTSRAGSGQQTQKPGSASPYGGELRKIMASQTPTHRSPWLAKRPTGRHTTREPSMSDEDEDGNEEEEEDYDDEDTEGSDDGESKVKNDFVPSSSVPLPIPRMSKVIESKSQAAVAADNDFAGAMSKSIDPGPALELLALENGRASRRGPEEDEDEDEDEDEERGEERQRKRDRDEEEAANEEEARDLMNRMIEGRGSLYAQRILSQTDRGVPASMWRSMA